MVKIIPTGPRLYLVDLPFAAKEQAKEALGLTGANFDRDRRQWWVGKAKAKLAEEFVAGLNAGDIAPVAEAPDDIRVHGKARYKGRSYYIRAYSNDRTKVKLITLDAKIEFWATLAVPGTDASSAGKDVAVIEKTYAPRKVGNSRYPRLAYTTLGSIRQYIEQQSNPETRRGECTECGDYGPAGQPCHGCHEGHFA